MILKKNKHKIIKIFLRPPLFSSLPLLPTRIYLLLNSTKEATQDKGCSAQIKQQQRTSFFFLNEKPSDTRNPTTQTHQTTKPKYLLLPLSTKSQELPIYVLFVAFREAISSMTTTTIPRHHVQSLLLISPSPYLHERQNATKQNIKNQTMKTSPSLLQYL